MKLKYTTGTVQAILTNIDTHDKITLEAVPSGPADEEGVTLFTYQTWSPPNQVDDRSRKLMTPAFFTFLVLRPDFLV